jgi:hypothetical protein
MNDTNKIIHKQLDAAEVITNKYTYVKKLDDGKYRKITMYSSNYLSGWAVNAIDNTVYNVRVGSSNERYLFSVRFVSHKFKGREDEVITLYYDSPYAYETHQCITLPTEVIQQWHTVFNSLPRDFSYKYKGSITSSSDSLVANDTTPNQVIVK